MSPKWPSPDFVHISGVNRTILNAIIADQLLQAFDMQEDDYRRFEESLNEEEDDDDSKENKHTKSSSKKDENSNEIRVGIKDWYVNRTWNDTFFSYPFPSLPPLSLSKEERSDHS